MLISQWLFAFYGASAPEAKVHKRTRNSIKESRLIRGAGGSSRRKEATPLPADQYPVCFPVMREVVHRIAGLTVSAPATQRPSAHQFVIIINCPLRPQQINRSYKHPVLALISSTHRG